MEIENNIQQNFEYFGKFVYNVRKNSYRMKQNILNEVLADEGHNCSNLDRNITKAVGIRNCRCGYEKAGVGPGSDFYAARGYR